MSYLRRIARPITSCFSSEYPSQKLENSTQVGTSKDSGFSTQHPSRETIDEEHADHSKADKEMQTVMTFLDDSQISLESGYTSGHQSTETINKEHAESKGRRPKEYVGHGPFQTSCEALDQEEVSATNVAIAQNEATIFCYYFQSKSLAIEEATKENVRKKMENASIINIAIHGNLVDGNIFLAPTSEPLASGTEDSYLLTAKDIKNCTLKAHLVVLNFCDGGGSVVSAKDLITIVSSFLESGTHSVLVKLWETNKEATQKFMQTFYENVCHGVPIHMALRQTMMSLKVEHPVADWSGYQIFGEDITLTENDIEAIDWQTSTR